MEIRDCYCVNQEKLCDACLAISLGLCGLCKEPQDSCTCFKPNK